MGRISEEDVARVRDATDIVQLVSETVPLRQKGRLFWGLCPFHGEKTSSFKVDPGTQLWHCFGCGLGGDAFGFLMKAQNLEFPDAVRLLAERARIDLVEDGAPGVPQGRKERLIGASEAAAEYFHKQLVGSKDPGAETARAYLAGRGFGSDVAKRWKLGYAPSARGALTAYLATMGFARDEAIEANLALAGDRGEVKDRFFNRVMFPIGDLSGRTIAFGGRVIGVGEPKYLNSAETPVFHKSQNLYAIDRAKSEIVASGTAVVVEGYTDVIALHEAGIRNAVATLGTALTARHVRLLGRFAKRVVYLFDGDEAGMRAADKAAEFLDFSSTPEAGSSRLDLLVAVIPEAQDPADYVGSRGADGMKAVIDGAQPLLRFVLDRRLDAHDLTTPEGRAKALASAASVLATVRGSILAQDYANHIADRLRVDYATVAAALKSAKPAFDSRVREDAEAADPTRAAAPPRATDARTRAEEELARQLVAAPELREKVRDLLAREGAIADQGLDVLIRAVVSAGELTGKNLYQAVAASAPSVAESLSTYLVETMERAEALDRFEEVRVRLLEFVLRNEVQQLQADMRSTDPVKESGTYDELFRKAADLQRQLAELRAGSRADRS
ncbi:MAG: DNA primase [Coriobacteriia bacterium]|nr:DNA primase [Coriobacteriia bacterium]